MAKMFKGATNSQQLLSNMLNSNPQAQQLMNVLKQGTISPKDLFYQMAQQKGVNPDLILNMLK